jgi:O-antigen ligase
MIRAFGLLALGLAGLLPGHYFPWTGFQQEVLAAIGALVLAVAALVERPPWRVQLTALTLLAGTLAAVPALQWAAGLIAYRSDALLPTMYLMGLGLAVVVARHLADTHPRFDEELLAMLAVAALTTCVFGLLQWAQWQPSFVHALAPGDRVYGNFLQPNHQACLLGLGLAALISLRASGRLRPVVALPGATLLLVGLAMTQSRAGWLMVGVLALLGLALQRRAQLKWPTTEIAATVALYAAAWWVLPLLTRAAVDAGTASLALRSQADSRWLHWQIIWDAVTRSPWWGYGWNQMSAAQQVAVLDHPPTFEWPSSSHNQALDLLVWNGLPLGLLAIGALMLWSAVALRRCSDARTWGLLAALAVLACHAMVELPLAYAYFLLPAALLAGAAESRLPMPGIRLPAAQALAAAATAVLAVALWAVVDEYLQIEEGVRQARFRDVGYAAQVTVPDVALLDGPREYLRLWATKNDDGDPGADMGWLRTVSLRFATPPALLRLATAAALRGETAEAERTLAILCHTAPPRQCDQGRDYWARQTQRHASLGQVAYPATPAR